MQYLTLYNRTESFNGLMRIQNVYGNKQAQVVILLIGFPNWRVSGMYIVEIVSMMEDCKYSFKIHHFDCCNSSGKSLVQLWAHPAIQSFF